jgi:Glycosyltransferase Family 4
MVSGSKDVIFLGNGRCYHTMDWFRSAQSLLPGNPPTLVTDLIDGESFETLVRTGDSVERMMVIDGVLFRKQSRLGDVWRNLVKLLVLPAQASRVRTLLRGHQNPIVHAHSMYYIAIARLSGCRYVATPQGSELLVRPYRSRAYRLFARMALSKASCVTVDSAAMQKALLELYGMRAVLLQNGIDVAAIQAMKGEPARADYLLSIRGFVVNYQLDELVAARDKMAPATPIAFCYPFWDERYRASVTRRLTPVDRDLGRLPRDEMYRQMASARLVVSIPRSDSSPRSVYEAIFCGAMVATVNGSWIANLPDCMRSRVIIVDLQSPTWLRDALASADAGASREFNPSPEALTLFDQQRSMRNLFDNIYPLVATS